MRLQMCTMPKTPGPERSSLRLGQYCDGNEEERLERIHQGLSACKEGMATVIGPCLHK